MEGDDAIEVTAQLDQLAKAAQGRADGMMELWWSEQLLLLPCKGSP